MEFVKKKVHPKISVQQIQRPYTQTSTAAAKQKKKSKHLFQVDILASDHFHKSCE